MKSYHVNDLTPAQFRRLSEFIRSTSGIFLSDEKIPLVNSRLAKRVRSLGQSNFDEYFEYITSPAGQEEQAEMLSAITTNVTSFFREKHHFDEFRNEIAPDMLKRARNGDCIRIWSAGCSSGEEPYSIAISLAECCSLDQIKTLDIKILATDIDPNMVKAAREGCYQMNKIENYKEYVDKYFEYLSGIEKIVRVKDELRDVIRFNVLNLMDQWPMRRCFDVIFCRNVMIYFDSKTQERLVERFAGQLSAGGCLFLGHSERVPETQMSSFRRAGLTSYRRC